MTLRRYAPLALAALALGCKPEIPERANTTTVEYAAFDPGGTSIAPPTPVIPVPNTMALQSFLDGTVPASVPCDMTGSAQNSLLCAFARAGGFAASGSPPYFMPIQIKLLTGTLASDGSVDYAGSPLDSATVKVAGLAAGPTVGVFAMNGATPVPVAVTVAYDSATGTLTLAPVSGSWAAGRNHVVLVRGGASGIKTTAASGALPYVAMPTMYILREAVLSDRPLDQVENQGLFPGDAAAKMASGVKLEPLRAAWAEGIYPLTLGLAAATGCAVAAPTCINLPFEDLVIVQTFQVAPGGALTIDDAAAGDPSDFSATGGAVAMIDAFTLQTSVATATVQAVVFALTEGDTALTNLFVSTSSTCAGGATGAATLGVSGTPTVGTNAIALTHWLSVGNTAPVPLYVCATTKTVASATNVKGAVATAVTFTGTGYVATSNDDGAQLTVNP